MRIVCMQPVIMKSPTPIRAVREDSNAAQCLALQDKRPREAVNLV